MPIPNAMKTEGEAMKAEGEAQAHHETALKEADASIEVLRPLPPDCRAWFASSGAYQQV